LRAEENLLSSTRGYSCSRDWKYILDWNEWATGRVPEKSGIVTQNELDIVTNSL